MRRHFNFEREFHLKEKRSVYRKLIVFSLFFFILKNMNLKRIALNVLRVISIISLILVGVAGIIVNVSVWKSLGEVRIRLVFF